MEVRNLGFSGITAGAVRKGMIVIAEEGCEDGFFKGGERVIQSISRAGNKVSIEMRPHGLGGNLDTRFSFTREPNEMLPVNLVNWINRYKKRR